MDMETNQVHDYSELFDQLGLPSDKASIKSFIEQHRPLDGDLLLVDAPFWNEGQREFIREKKKTDDAEWTIVIDQLNTELRKENV